MTETESQREKFDWFAQCYPVMSNGDGSRCRGVVGLNHECLESDRR
ncbi:unnamed protein product [Linum tenue]|uniref:Uncharacterized protein n=1 Tax=Linum tenue TaxID=586396 RepID=A0AAV0KKZ3_9ROSI|nr:unnamed protein product [Linum tenue]